jgi:hypothetical protein
MAAKAGMVSQSKLAALRKPVEAQRVDTNA